MKMKLSIYVTLFVGICIVLPSFAVEQMKCNGHSLLCKRRFNQVTLPCAHNGQSYKNSPVQNQDKSVTQQLQDGIRGMKVPVHWDLGNDGKKTAMACHGIKKDEIFTENWFNVFFNSLGDLGAFNTIINGLKKTAEPIYELVHKAIIIAYGDVGKEGVIPFRPCMIDNSPPTFQELCTEIKTFLDKNPNEVYFLLVENFIEDADEFDRVFTASGIKDIAYVHDNTKLWPTLEEMINANKRVVITGLGPNLDPTEKYPYMSRTTRFATEYNFQNVAQISSNTTVSGPTWLKRWDPQYNKLFVFQHFITPLIAGSLPLAKQANEKSVMRARAKAITEKADYLPNIFLVDFYEQPNMDVFDVVDELNGVGAFAGKPLVDFSAKWAAWEK